MTIHQREFDPAQWWREAESVQRLAQAEASLALALPAKIDEVSLLFHTRRQMDIFMDYSVGTLAADHFNGTTDVLERTDASGSIPVRFEFLRMPDSDWRIEAMCIDGPTSVAPLHHAALVLRGSPYTIHASFKLPSVEEYADVRNAMAKDFIRGMRAEYVNAYGRFAYFGQEGWYYKPRVNTRD